MTQGREGNHQMVYDEQAPAVGSRALAHWGPLGNHMPHILECHTEGTHHSWPSRDWKLPLLYWPQGVPAASGGQGTCLQGINGTTSLQVVGRSFRTNT